ncbi:MAG: SpoIID/LytB domain-containing protein [Deltaproteobacteria bacterium]|nr:MAG: SpoIID/LytB domain-containing protein [Deltaproteobacteria bacterium]
MNRAPLVLALALAVLPRTAAALLVEDYDEARWSALADCTIEATWLGEAPAFTHRGLHVDRLLLDQPVAVGPCDQLPNTVVWPARHRPEQHWFGGPDLPPGTRVRLHTLRWPGTGAHTVLGLGRGVRPAAGDGPVRPKFAFDTRGPDGAPLFWPAATATFRFHRHSVPGVPWERMQAQATDALDMWSAPACASLVLEQGVPFDDEPDFDVPGNTVAFWEDSFVGTGGAVVIAFTLVGFNDAGHLTRATIRLNAADRRWSTDGEIGTYDLRGVLAHELGHAVGLAHSAFAEAVMFRHVSPSRSLGNRILDEDDVEGLCTLYPCPDDDCERPFPPPGLDLPSVGADLCAPCAVNDDCGGPRDLCVRRTAESPTFCARECHVEHLPCPTDFTCLAVNDGFGGTLRQCVPDAGTCPDTSAVVCEPCLTDEDCGPDGQPLCIREDTGALVCAPSCAGGLACPDGAVCQLVPLEDGAAELCRPLSGACVTPPDELPEDETFSSGGCGTCAAGGPFAPGPAGWFAVAAGLLLLRRRRAVALALTALAVLVPGLAGAPATAEARSIEWTRADRLAVLYSPQLRFTADGEPLVTIGIADGDDRMRITPSGEARLLPVGMRDAEVRIPGGSRLTVRMEDGAAGTYEHHVVVADFRPAEREALQRERERWEGLGHTMRVHQVGSIFAVRGQSFDTRRVLLTLGETADRAEARALAREIEREHGVEARLHSLLESHPGGTIVVEGLPGGVSVRSRDLLRLEPVGDTTFRVEDVAFDRGTHMAGRETREFTGAMIVTADRDGMLSLINELPIERAVAGILPAEIYASAPEAALQAQAVAARSELFADFGVRHLSEPWMTCADQMCQVYRGITHENRRTTAAVRATRGIVVVDGDRIINAFFSANNGGFAGMNSTTWGGEQRSYLRARYDGPEDRPEWRDGLPADAVRAFLENPPDAFSAITSFSAGRTFRWDRTLQAGELTEAVAARHPGVGRVQGLEVLSRDASGRITRLRVRGSEGEVVIERELNIRRALGGLRSALFVFDEERDAGGALRAVHLLGGGFGHGVGLCQSGAIGAAERGMDYREIIANYYPGTALRALF